ncbi:MAG: hypothetical protein ABF868_08235 [Sporolactobacillus sp.]
MSNRRSNQNICDFYKDKSKDALTLKYFAKWPPKESGNAYLTLYENFCRKEFSCENADNESLYHVIEAWENIERAKFPIQIIGEDQEHIGTICCRSQMPDLDFLKDVDIDLLNPALNHGESANQKWHLFVGIFAYSVVCKSSFKWEKDFRAWPSQVLRLWMLENAENQQGVLKKIKSAIDNDNSKLCTNALICNAFEDLLKEG